MVQIILYISYHCILLTTTVKNSIFFSLNKKKKRYIMRFIATKQT